MVVKSLLVISVAALYLAIVPGCPGTNRLMLDVKAATEHIQGMDPVRLLRVSEFSAIIRLDQCGRITKIADRPPDKDAVQRAGMPGISFVLPQLAI